MLKDAEPIRLNLFSVEGICLLGYLSRKPRNERLMKGRFTERIQMSTSAAPTPPRSPSPDRALAVRRSSMTSYRAGPALGLPSSITAMAAETVEGSPILPAEIMEIVVEFTLQSHRADATSSRLFALIAPLTLASSQLRLLAFRRFLRHIILSDTEFSGNNSQWNRFFRLLDSLDERTNGECFTWVRSLRAPSKTLMGRFHSAQLAALTYLEELFVDLASEGFTTQKHFLKLINNASPKLTVLALTSLPCIDIPLLRLIATAFPCLLDLYLSCTERLEFHCWSCYEESLGRTIHSPIPGIFSDSRGMAIVFAKILKPLAHLAHLHLGIYLSDEMLIQYHIDHAEGEERHPFGPELCTLCDEVADEVQLRELTAALEFAQSLKALRTVGFSSFFADIPEYSLTYRHKPDPNGPQNETTIHVLRENGRIRVRRTPWTL
ncbi:Deacetylase sirtuin-type domain-containing protein [Mycena sanguinolenta]|uniref:Deacetylase sirtuin-type domain-containing protein n=1 Tax=Mycena sanguinolenta TaxID=230812 RepID=A0A8H6Z6A0_9AGAR|nr:Deacetylase sirtuin-type domain-containing protein [Mycena sanguinolenta]